MQVENVANAKDTEGRASSPRRTVFRAKLDTIQDVQAQVARCYRDARSGVLKVEDASRLANILSILARLKESSDLERRLDAVEQRGMN